MKKERNINKKYETPLTVVCIVDSPIRICQSSISDEGGGSYADDQW